MDITGKCRDLKMEVGQFDAKSFAGFFSYFIRLGFFGASKDDYPEFYSTLKDFLYLIGLNVFSERRGSKKFDLDEKFLRRLGASVSAIKNSYHPASVTDYSSESAMHAMAFQNYYHNAPLSYVQQDLEKIRRIFSPFDEIIEARFGFNVDTAIEIYKHTELIYKIRFEQMMAYAKTKEFQKFREDINSGKYTFEKGFALLSKDVQEGFRKFQDNTFAFFLFRKGDLTHLFEAEKIDKFLSIFSCTPGSTTNYLYYTDPNPLELAPILKLQEDTYLHVCQKLIPSAIYSRFYQFLLQDKGTFDKVRKNREAELEKKTVEILKEFFGKEAFYYENYYVHENHEQDLIILWKGCVFIVEVKASKTRAPLRDFQKALIRIKDDFEDSIQYGYRQCKRVEELFGTDETIEIRNKQKSILYSVNPKKYHSVFSIVVTLERLGPLQTDLSLLLKKDGGDPFPWSVYIDDLETFLKSLKKISKGSLGSFANFLKERQQLHGHSYSIDELDICAEFLLDRNKFARNARKTNILIAFSPKNQGLFDDLYNDRHLNFTEEVLPDPKRYFANAPDDFDKHFSS